MTTVNWILIGALVTVALWKPVWIASRRVYAWRRAGGPAAVADRPTLDKLEQIHQAVLTLISLDHEEVCADYLLRILASVDTMPDKIESSLHTQSLKSLEVTQAAMVALLNESVAQTKGVMRAMMGSAGTEDDAVIERAQALRQQYPEMSLEDAIRGARELATYSRR